MSQLPLPLPPPDSADQVAAWLRTQLSGRARPAASEFLAALAAALGTNARWHLAAAMRAEAALRGKQAVTAADRDYLLSMLDDGSLTAALHGKGAAPTDIVSSIDTLLRHSAVYRATSQFREMIAFMSNFRRYSPYNNMLVRTQNPSCSFYATASDWQHRLGRQVNQDARPMLILAPMGPVMLVYDLDNTSGEPLPEELRGFSRFAGPFDPRWLDQLIANAAGHGIRVEVKPLSSTHGGFATNQGAGAAKMRIVVDEGLDLSGRFGVLCHELAHILLGHLGADDDLWWPARANLDHPTVEIEAESVAYIVTARFGLAGSSAQYLSAYTDEAALPLAISLDTIARVAGHIEQMCKQKMPPRKPRPLGKKP